MAKRREAKSAHDVLDRLRSDRTLQKRLAKFMALQCFRNTRLEDLHAGVAPASDAGDYSDVKVVSPFGDIPWLRLSRLNDAEMRELMIDVVDRCYTFVRLLSDSDEAHRLLDVLRQSDVAPDWKEPTLRRRRARAQGAAWQFRVENRREHSEAENGVPQIYIAIELAQPRKNEDGSVSPAEVEAVRSNLPARYIDVKIVHPQDEVDAGGVYTGSTTSYVAGDGYECEVKYAFKVYDAHDGHYLSHEPGKEQEWVIPTVRARMSTTA